MTLQVGLLEAGIAAAVLAGVCGATWFAADAHYSQALASLEGQLEGAAKAQKTAVDAQIATDQAAAKEIDGEAQQQIGSMASVISDLSVRVASGGRTVSLCTTAASTLIAHVQPDRPAATASPGPPANPAAAAPGVAPVSPAGVDLGSLTDAIELGVESVKAELLWREYARRTGQAK